MIVGEAFRSPLRPASPWFSEFTALVNTSCWWRSSAGWSVRPARPRVSWSSAWYRSKMGWNLVSMSARSVSWAVGYASLASAWCLYSLKSSRKLPKLHSHRLADGLDAGRCGGFLASDKPQLA